MFIFNSSNIAGTSGDDVLLGTSAANTIDGLAGNDTIHGFGGSDTLLGGIGDDVLFGGDGADTLTGGADADEFVFLADSGGGPLVADTILDYSSAEGDFINLDDILPDGFDPSNAHDHISLVAGPTTSDSILQVDGTDVATLIGVNSTSDTINIYFDHSEMIAFSNSVVT